jgi:hypothetical protein
MGGAYPYMDLNANYEKAKNVTLKAASSNVRSAIFDIFLDIFSFKYN